MKATDQSENWGYHRLHDKLRAESIGEMKRSDRLKDAVARMNRGIEICRSHADNGSRALLKEILTSEQVSESHYLA